MKVACINRKAFKRILGPLEEIMKRNEKEYDNYMKKNSL